MVIGNSMRPRAKFFISGRADFAGLVSLFSTAWRIDDGRFDGAPSTSIITGWNLHGEPCLARFSGLFGDSNTVPFATVGSS